MSREYKITCAPLQGTVLSEILHRLPSPIKRPEMKEIYNFRVEDDGYYIIDHEIDRPRASLALVIFLDAALSTGKSATVTEL